MHLLSNAGKSLMDVLNLKRDESVKLIKYLEKNKVVKAKVKMTLETNKHGEMIERSIKYDPDSDIMLEIDEKRYNRNTITNYMS